MKGVSAGLIVHENEGVLSIGINNPARYNAMTLQMWRDLKEHVSAANKHDHVRVLIIRGLGDRAFMSGADITEFEKVRSSSEQIDTYDQAVEATQSALTTCTKPTIAAIKGICMGGGMGISAACDLRYASANAVFRMPAARVGLGYSLDSMARMVDVLGVARALDVFMTARKFDAAEAARIGFVQEIFPDDDFETMVQERVDQIRFNAPLTLRAAKLSVNHVVDAPHSADRATVLAALKACFESDDYIEGQRAFKEKRMPQFTGK